MIFNPVFVLIASVAAALAIAYAVYTESRAHITDFKFEPHQDARLLILDRQAIEQAYMQQVVYLFQQWMKDETQQPERAMRGVKNARNAYGHAIAALEKREKEHEVRP